MDASANSAQAVDDAVVGEHAHAGGADQQAPCAGVVAVQVQGADQAEGQADQIAERDRLDTQRKTAPLVLPPGATGIDSTYLTLQQVVEKHIL